MSIDLFTRDVSVQMHDRIWSELPAGIRNRGWGWAIGLISDVKVRVWQHFASHTTRN